MLPPCHFGEPASDMRMRGLERACLVKGPDGVGKLPAAEREFPCVKAWCAKVSCGASRETGMAYACRRRPRLQTIPPIHSAINTIMTRLAIVSPSLAILLPPAAWLSMQQGMSSTRLHAYAPRSGTCSSTASFF